MRRPAAPAEPPAGPIHPPQATAATINAPEARRVLALSWRGAIAGVVCVAATCLIVCQAELVVGQIQIGFLQLPPAVVGMLLALLAVQAGLRRLSGRLLLARHEIFAIYVMMLLAAMVASRGLMERLIPLLVAPNYYADASNGWRGLFFSHIPGWAVPFNPARDARQPVAAQFYEALKPGEAIPWRLWAGPLAAWGLLVALMLAALLCLAVIVRRQWVDNERLGFPLVQLPLEVVRAPGPGTAAGPGLLRSGIAWMGFAVPALVFGFNGLHQWFPTIPDIRTDVDLNQMLVEPPWNGIGFLHAFVSFAAIGFFFLLPTDLLFSLWFFFGLTVAGDVLSAVKGWQPEYMPLFCCRLYVGYQTMGCYLVLAAYMAWVARSHLARVCRSAWNPRRLSGPAEDEVLSYRTAFWGLAASLLLSAAWLALFGMSYWVALGELLVVVFVVGLVMARSTSECGMLMTETSFRPVDMYRMVGDPRGLGAANLTGLAFMDVLWARDQRGLLLTGFLDSMKLADGACIRRRSLLGVFVLALVVAVAVSGFLHVALPYRLGAGQQMYSYVYRVNPVLGFNDASTVLTGGRPALPWFARENFLVGIVVTLALFWLRARLPWFPLHPMGYALCGTWTMIVFWFPCVVAWLAKVLVLRYGGRSVYGRARLFCLGMVLGEFTMAVLWTLPSLFWHTPTPAFPWP